MEDEFIQNGLIAVAQGNYVTAVDQFTKALQKNDKSYKGLLYRGVAHFQIGDYETSLKDFNEAEKLRKDEDEFYYLRGKCYFYYEKLDLAKADFEKALTLKDINEEQKNKINDFIEKLKE